MDAVVNPGARSERPRVSSRGLLVCAGLFAEEGNRILTGIGRAANSTLLLHCHIPLHVDVTKEARGICQTASVHPPSPRTIIRRRSPS